MKLDCIRRDCTDLYQQHHIGIPLCSLDFNANWVLCRWWKDAHDSLSVQSNGKKGIMFAASPALSYSGPMKLINNIFNSDLAFNLRREEDTVQDGECGEVGVSGRDFALVSGEMWVQALKW